MAQIDPRVGDTDGKVLAHTVRLMVMIILQTLFDCLFWVALFEKDGEGRPHVRNKEGKAELVEDQGD